jgi:hypothetical protein
MTNQTPKWIPALFGLASFVMGALILGAVAGIVPADTGGFIAPRWVITAIGVGMILTSLIFWIPASTPAALKGLLALSVFLLVAVVCNWTAFAPGIRYSSSASIGPFSFQGEDQLGGRIAFGLAAVIIDALLLWGVIDRVRHFLHKQ